MDTYVKYAKAGLGLVVGSGVATIVKTVVQRHVQPATKIQKVTVFVGRHALQSVIISAVNEQVDKKVDRFVEELKLYQVRLTKGDS